MRVGEQPALAVLRPHRKACPPRGARSASGSHQQHRGPAGKRNTQRQARGPAPARTRALAGVLLLALPGQREVGGAVRGKHLHHRVHVLLEHLQGVGGRGSIRQLGLSSEASCSATRVAGALHTHFSPIRWRPAHAAARAPTCAVLPLVMICSASWCLGERGVFGSSSMLGSCPSIRSVALGCVGISSGGTAGPLAPMSPPPPSGGAAAAPALDEKREAPTRRPGRGGVGAAGLGEAGFLGEKAEAMTWSAWRGVPPFGDRESGLEPSMLRRLRRVRLLSALQAGARLEACSARRGGEPCEAAEHTARLRRRERSAPVTGRRPCGWPGGRRGCAAHGASAEANEREQQGVGCAALSGRTSSIRAAERCKAAAGEQARTMRGGLQLLAWAWAGRGQRLAAATLKTREIEPGHPVKPKKGDGPARA